MNHYLKIILRNIANLNAAPLEWERIMTLKNQRITTLPIKKSLKGVSDAVKYSQMHVGDEEFDIFRPRHYIKSHKRVAMINIIHQSFHLKKFHRMMQAGIKSSSPRVLKITPIKSDKS